jgi:hypothetical protein
MLNILRCYNKSEIFICICLIVSYVSQISIPLYLSSLFLMHINIFQSYRIMSFAKQILSLSENWGSEWLNNLFTFGHSSHSSLNDCLRDDITVGMM